VIPFPTEDRSDENIMLLKDVTGKNGREQIFCRDKIRETWRAERMSQKIGNLRLVRVADHVGDAGECGEFFGSALGVAASNDDAGGGIVSMKFADGVAGLGVGSRSDSTSVEDDDIGGFGGTRQGAAAFEELAFDGSAVGLSGAAAELFDVQGGHERIVYRQRFSVDSFTEKSRRGEPGSPCFNRDCFNRDLEVVILKELEDGRP